ncbi:MAG: ATP-binding protein, partial [Bacteroidetes bacterium QH_2_64_26]
MQAFPKTYTDLDRALDEVQSLPDEWPAAHREDGP